MASVKKLEDHTHGEKTSEQSLMVNKNNKRPFVSADASVDIDQNNNNDETRQTGTFETTLDLKDENISGDDDSSFSRRLDKLAFAMNGFLLKRAVDIDLSGLKGDLSF